MNTLRLQAPRFPVVAGCVAVAAVLAGLSAAHAAPARSGKEVVEAVCISCHETGKDGAPRIGNSADWAPRAKDGMDRLPRSAMDGLRKMPSHGGQPVLSDLEMSRAISYMVSGGHAPDPNKTFGTVSHGSGEQIVASACGNCHREGLNGAPKIGDIDAWLPRLQKGLDILVSSATQGHNKMPSRGGFSALSDVDVRNAVSYMVSKANAPKK